MDDSREDAKNAKEIKQLNVEELLGLLINFGAPTFREGVRRIVNNHTDLASSRLHVNQKPNQ